MENFAVLSIFYGNIYLKNETPKLTQRSEQSVREVALRVWPCLIIVFARNWAKGPKPTMPILRFVDGEENEADEDEPNMVVGFRRQQPICYWGVQIFFLFLFAKWGFLNVYMYISITNAPSLTRATKSLNLILYAFLTCSLVPQ